MKKFLLTLLSCVCVCATALAGSYTITFKSNTSDSDSSTRYSAASDVNKIIETGGEYVVSFSTNTQYVYLGKNGYGLKFSTASTKGILDLALTENGSVKPTSIVVTAAQYKDGEDAGLSVNDSEAQSITGVDFADYTYTFDGNTQITKLKLSATQKRMYVTKVVVNFEDDEMALSAPVITLGDNNTVTIEQAENAPVYFTTNGTAPSTSTREYEDPFQIIEKCTIKAIAIQDGQRSAIATKEVYLNVVSDFASFIANGSSTATKVNAPVTAIYQNGRNLYLKDGAGKYLLAYNSNNLSTVAGQYTNGDVISSITGTYHSQAGLPELIPTEVGEKSTGTAVEPETYTIDEISMSMLNEYVKIEGLNIAAAASNNNYTATDADGKTITLYNTFYNSNYYDVVTVPEGEGFTVTGFVSCYNSTLQITPIEITGGVAMETVATPTFTPEAGEVAAGSEISIACATEGASIYYTTDESEPTSASTLYTAPISITEAVTIKAIAVKNGMLDSDVATAAYTLQIEGATTTTFDFSAVDNHRYTPEEPVLDTPATSNGTDIAGKTFYSGDLTLAFAENENSSKARFWNSTKGLEVRVYGTDKMTLAAPEGVSIKSIKFIQLSGSTNWAGMEFSPEGTWAAGTKTWTATGDVNSVVMTPTGTNRFLKMEVVTVGAAGEEPVEYCILEGTVSRTDRGVTTLNITDNLGGSLNVEGSGLSYGHALYKDCTSSVFTTAPGAELTVNVTEGAGEWMHSYVYIDYDNDGVFEYDINTTKADNELVAFNCYGAGQNIGNDASTWYNSLGETLTGSQPHNHTIVNGNIPSFTLPADLAPGNYRIRFKTDWNDANPCGRTSGDNQSLNNGASMIDFTIRIEAPARDYALTIVCTPEDDIYYTLSDKNNDEVTDLTAIAAGTELTLNAGTISGRDLKVTLNDEELSMFEYVYTFNMPESDATLTIEAVETLYTVTISDVENGSIEVLAGETAVNSGDRVAEGTELTVNATPAEGYLLTSILVDGEAIEGNTVTVNADVTISALFEEEAEEPAEYCTIEGTVSRGDRGVNTLNISDNFGGSLDVEGSGTRPGRAIYKDCTSSVFTTAPGAELTVNVTDGAGEWMHSYVYIDYNNNGVFEYDPSTTKADNELVAFNCYGAGSEATWYNSLGEILGDAHMFIANGDIPSFTLPADLADGDYRIRFKTDWNDANPCGRTTGGNLSSDNGASMIDFTIRIDANAAIDGIISDAAADATAEYYNLQGIKVSADNLTPGFYIVRQGDKATKVLIRK